MRWPFAVRAALQDSCAVNYETTVRENRAPTKRPKAPPRSNPPRGGPRRPPGPKEIGVLLNFLSWLTDPRRTEPARSTTSLLRRGLMTWLMRGETPLSVTAVVNHDKPEIYPAWTTTPPSCSPTHARP